MIRISKTELKKYIEKAFEEELYKAYSSEIRERANVPPKNVLVRNLLNDINFLENLILDLEDQMTVFVQNSDEYYTMLNRHRIDCEDIELISCEETNAIELLTKRGYSVAKKCQ